MTVTTKTSGCRMSPAFIQEDSPHLTWFFVPVQWWFSKTISSKLLSLCSFSEPVCFSICVRGGESPTGGGSAFMIRAISRRTCSPITILASPSEWKGKRETPGFLSPYQGYGPRSRGEEWGNVSGQGFQCRRAGARAVLSITCREGCLPVIQALI